MADKSYSRRVPCPKQNINLVLPPGKCIQGTILKQQREAALCRSIKLQLMTCKAQTAPRVYLHCKRPGIFTRAFPTPHRIFLKNASQTLKAEWALWKQVRAMPRK